jgi:Abnormal spindle-like microcephaly-assoc'd, ASPM-SPD-2-Hydin
VKLGATSRKDIVLANTSFNTITIDSITLGAKSMYAAALALPANLATNDALTLTIAFAPASFGTFPETVKIYSTAGMQTVSVDGSSPVPAIALSASALPFGDCLRGIAASRTLVVKNSSLNVLSLDSVYTKTRWFTCSISKGSVIGTSNVIGNGTGKITVNGMFNGNSEGTVNGTVGSADSLTLTVTFTPDAFQAYADTLIILNNSTTKRIALPLTGNSPAPTLSLSASALAFGDCLRGVPATRTVVIKNSSLNALSLDSVYAKTRAFTSSIVKAIINGTGGSADSLSISVSFTPDAFQAFTDTLIVLNNSNTRRIALPLTGNSPAPVLTLSAQNLSFGSMKLGTSTRKDIVLKNSSFNAITVDSITVGATSMYALSSVPGSASPITMKTNDSITVTVAFAPSVFGTFTDTVRIYSTMGRQTVSVDGASPIPAIALSASTLSFGNSLRGVPAARTFVIKNSSLNALTLDSVYTKTRWFTCSISKGSVNGTSNVIGNSTGNGTGNIIGNGNGTITVNGIFNGNSEGTANGIGGSADSLTLTVTFTPDAFQTYADTLIILNNSSSKRIALPLTGNSPAPVLALSAQSLSFGSVKVGATARREIVLVDTSFNVITIDSITISKHSAFTLNAQLPVVLKANDTLRAAVLFTPDSAKHYADTVFVYCSTLNAVAKIALSGDGDNSTGIVQRLTGVPEAYSISQNFPNPFNPSTAIQFAAPAPSHVTIAIYDVTGREVACVFNDNVRAGYYTAVWNAAGASSGTYFYRISAYSAGGAGSYVQTKKLILIK